MMPLELFGNRCFSGLNLLTFLLYGAFGAAMLLIPYVLISSGGYSPVEAGLAMLPMPVLMTVGFARHGQSRGADRAAHPAHGRSARRRGGNAPFVAHGAATEAIGPVPSRRSS